MTAIRAARHIDRDVRMLYDIAHTLGRLSLRPVGGPRACLRLHVATSRARAAEALARRIHARPGVAEHEETAYALQQLRRAMARLTGPEGGLLLLSGAAAMAALTRPEADTAALLELSDRTRHLARTVAQQGGETERRRLDHELEQLRERAVTLGLHPDEAAGVREVPLPAFTIPHPQVRFSNAISRRGRERMCFLTEESARAAARDYRPFNNTHVETGICTAEHGHP